MPSRTARRGLRDLPNVEQQHVNRVQFVQVIVQERAGAYFHLALGVKLPTKITEVRTVRECAYRVTELEQILVADCGQVWVAAMKYEPAQPPGETRRGAGRGVAELGQPVDVSSEQVEVDAETGRATRGVEQSGVLAAKQQLVVQAHTVNQGEISQIAAGLM
jgi:hypothetical protein